MFKFKVIVKDDERAFLTRDGVFVRLLGPGRFTAFDFGRHLAAEFVKVARVEAPVERALRLARTHPQVAADNFEIVQLGAKDTTLVNMAALAAFNVSG